MTQYITCIESEVRRKKADSTKNRILKANQAD